MAVTKEKVLVEQTKNTYFCDECGKKMEHWHRCDVCRKEICRECLYIGGFSEMNWKDVPDCDHEAYCKRCWSISELFKEEYLQARSRHSKELEGVMDRWKEQSLKGGGT